MRIVPEVRPPPNAAGPGANSGIGEAVRRCADDVVLDQSARDVISDPDVRLRAPCDLPDAGLGLVVFELGNGGGDGFPERPDLAGEVHEADVNRIERVLDHLEPIARPDLEARIDDEVFSLERLLARQVEFGRCAAAHIGEN